MRYLRVCSFKILWCFLATSLALLPLAHGFAQDGVKMTEEDDPGFNVRAMAVNRIISILRFQQDSVSDECATLLSDMQKAQEQLGGLEKGNDDNPDIGLGRDVLSSDMEEVITQCGRDALAICQAPHGAPDQTPKQDEKSQLTLPKLCQEFEQTDQAFGSDE